VRHEQGALPKSLRTVSLVERTRVAGWSNGAILRGDLNVGAIIIYGYSRSRNFSKHQCRFLGFLSKPPRLMCNHGW
jgi:hypothetical protein